MKQELHSMDYLVGRSIIQFTTSDPALLNVDAVVEEQDTHLLMGKTPVIRESVESFAVLVKKMEQGSPEKAGQVIVKLATPIRFIAIVYDIDQPSICHATNVAKAFDSIFKQCKQHQVNTLAMPLLGSSYGQLKNEDILELMQVALLKRQHQFPKKILIYNNIKMDLF